MSTTIEWTQRPGTKGETWNPVVGCTKVSAGCKNCYAKTIHDNRHKAFSEGKLQNVKQYAKPFEHVQLMPERLAMPMRWKSPRTIFVNSVSDLFHADVPFSYIDQVFAVMALTPQHTYQILTKRPERMAEYLSSGQKTYLPGNPRENGDGTARRGHVINEEGSPSDRIMVEAIRMAGVQWAGDLPEHYWPMHNVWLGTSVENQATADERIPHLLRCPAAVRFLSCEPLLGVVDLTTITLPEAIYVKTVNALTGHGMKVFTTAGGISTPRIDWVIAGGESGSKARPMHPDSARGLRDQCAAAGVAFFFKQWGAWEPCLPSWYDLLPDDNRVFWGEPSGLTGWRCGPLPRTFSDILDDSPSTVEFTTMHKVGKRNAGRLLDNVEHSAWPAPRPAPVPDPAT